MIVAGIPSPTLSAISLGPLQIHFYALCILAGIVLAMWWAARRWTARGGDGDDLFDIGFVAVIAGILGARIYHVISSPDAYFGPDGNPVRILAIWNGGLGIWGGVAGGAFGAYVMARRKRVSFAALADTVAPTLMVAQAVGRLGNWFNQELYGGPTSLPWGLEISCRQNGGVIGGCVPGTYHPTFLYEMLWNLVGCVLLLALERRFRLGGGRTFWAYVAIYTCGRLWIEMMRTDAAEIVLGMRVNVWVAGAMLLLSLVMLVVLTRRRARRGGEAHRSDGAFGPAGPSSLPAGATVRSGPEPGTGLGSRDDTAHDVSTSRRAE